MWTVKNLIEVLNKQDPNMELKFGIDYHKKDLIFTEGGKISLLTVQNKEDESKFIAIVIDQGAI